MRQQRTFSYDAADRLLSVTYNTDSTQIQYGYDPAGNVLRRTKRKGDVFQLGYDKIDRLTAVQSFPAGGSNTAAWAHQHTYDGSSNRTGFYDSPPAYDSASFDSVNLGGASTWAVPSPGYDAMDRLPQYQDRLGNATSMSYDVESRLSQITYPNGTPAPTMTAAYDVMSRTGVTTADGQFAPCPLRQERRLPAA